MKIILFSILSLSLLSCSSKNWKSASRESVGIALPASEQKEDVFQIYYARAFSWRGYFATHPWVAWKKAEDKEYTVAQVTSWNLRRENSSVSVASDLPDRRWYDNEPTMLFEVKGKEAAVIIEKVKLLIRNYPYKDVYTLYPGPNSNTFVSYLIRNIEELKTELPPHAIGKDYLGGTKFFADSPSNTGYQLSAFGLLGLTVGQEEGVEVNLLGLSFGIDFWRPAVKLPFVGRLGFSN